jgi:acyl-CoA synthetase (AMP-forming)/AMP-acid ligase II
VAETSADFLVRFFAVLAGGGTCVPIAPPLPGEDGATYRANTRQMLSAAGPALVLTAEGTAEEFLGWPAATLTVPEEPGGPRRLAPSPAAPGMPALIQFSSGSTGVRRAVRVSRAAVDANFSAINQWMPLGPSDRSASWLPLHHDMGLLGQARVIANQCDLMLMSSLQFLRRPEMWLLCHGRYGATIATAPSFGYVHLARKVAASSLSDCDLSGWRVAIVGAEPLRADDLDLFVDAFAPLGFRRRAFCPAYGLAEATLAVTGTGPDQEPAVLPDGWAPAGPAGVGSQGARFDHRMVAADRMVGSGKALDGVAVSVRDEAGAPLPDDHLGEVWVGGTSLADGYEPPSGDDFGDGWFRTGDVGCLRDGELFVFGRLSDSIQIRGEMILAEAAERSIREALPTARSLVAVPSRSHGAGLTVVAEFAAPLLPNDAERARAAISRIFRGTEVDLVVVDRGAIPRTTSGKPMRRESWRRYVVGSA